MLRKVLSDYDKIRMQHEITKDDVLRLQRHGFEPEEAQNLCIMKTFLFDFMEYQEYYYGEFQRYILRVQNRLLFIQYMRRKGYYNEWQERE